MRYVLDSSVALKWVLPESDSPKAITLRDHFRNQVHEHQCEVKPLESSPLTETNPLPSC
jgi:hypothetical protein